MKCQKKEKTYVSYRADLKTRPFKKISWLTFWFEKTDPLVGSVENEANGESRSNLKNTIIHVANAFYVANNVNMDGLLH